MKKDEKKKISLLILILIILDQIIKFFVIFKKLKIESVNTFGIGIVNNVKTENNISYILMAIIAIMLIIRYMKSNNSFIKNDSRIILSFAISGALSNTIDRIWNGATINYINIPKFTQINLGYVYYIVTWIGMAAILTKYSSERLNERKIKKEVENEKNNRKRG